METQIFVTLMTSAISFAGQVLSAAISQVKKIKGQASNYIYDKKFLEKTISDSTQKFTDLLESKSAEIKQEIKDESIRSAIRDVQAHIAALKQLLAFTETAELNAQLAAQLVISALLPLHVSLEKAKLCLYEYEKEDLWTYFHVIGTSTLIAGYAYLGQEMPSLQEELNKAIRESQVRMLNSIAKMMVQAQLQIPWEQVPQLMSVESINELSDLYTTTAEKVKVKQENISQSTKVSSKSDIYYATKLRNPYTGALSCSICKSAIRICPKIT